MPKLLSICIPTYNRINQLKRQITFLLSEGVCSLDDIEVIVSDNASADGSFDDYLRNINESNFKVFKQEKNIGANNNFLFLEGKASGEYIWLIADDDELEPGIIHKVLQILHKYHDVDYIFINHKVIQGNLTTKDSFYSANGGYYYDGLAPFSTLVKESGFGPAMFITANIFRLSRVLEVNSILKINNETENLAMPLAYSLFSANGPAYFISQPMISDQSEGISWSDLILQVHCRDMIAVLDIIGESIGKSSYISDLTIKNLPRKYPVLKYSLVKYKFKKSNYAFHFYCKYFPWLLVIDFVLGPFDILFNKLINILKKQ